MPKSSAPKKPRPCPECPKYKTCREMCPEVEAWVSQDETGLGTSTMTASHKATKIVRLSESMGSNIHGCVDLIEMIASEGDAADMWRNGDVDRWSAWQAVSALNLSPKLEEIAWLHYWEGKRIKEIAEILGQTSSTIDKRHQLLKRHVASRMKRRQVWKLIESGDYYYGGNLITRMILESYFSDLKGVNEIRQAMNLQYGQVGEPIKKCLAYMEAEYGIRVGGTSLKN